MTLHHYHWPPWWTPLLHQSPTTKCSEILLTYKEATQDAVRTKPKTCKSEHFSAPTLVQHPVPPAKVTGIQETPFADMSGKSKIAIGGPPVKTIEFQFYSFTDTVVNSKQAEEAANVAISLYRQLDIIYAACEIVKDDAESGANKAEEAKVGIIYAACKIVEDDAEPGTAFKTSSTIVNTGRQPPTSAPPSFASSGTRSEAPIPKKKAAAAA
jgi:hypothetical protein